MAKEKQVAEEELEEEDLEIVRVCTKLYQYEMEWLHFLAKDSGRSMSTFLRFLVREVIANRR